MSGPYACALCSGEITVADSARGRLMTVNVDGHGKAAHRECPPGPSAAERAAAATYLLCACGRYWDYATMCVCGRDVSAPAPVPHSS